LIGLSEQNLDGVAVIELRRCLQAGIAASTALDAIIAR
jgi:hypothetical protein